MIERQPAPIELNTITPIGARVPPVTGLKAVVMVPVGAPGAVGVDADSWPVWHGPRPKPQLQVTGQSKAHCAPRTSSKFFRYMTMVNGPVGPLISTSGGTAEQSSVVVQAVLIPATACRTIVVHEFC